MSNIEIDTSDLINKLHKTMKLADNDPARVIELLLLENHILSQNQSDGFMRRRQLVFSSFPRFIELSQIDENQEQSV